MIICSFHILVLSSLLVGLYWTHHSTKIHILGKILVKTGVQMEALQKTQMLGIPGRLTIKGNLHVEVVTETKKVTDNWDSKGRFWFWGIPRKTDATKSALRKQITDHSQTLEDRVNKLENILKRP